MMAASVGVGLMDLPVEMIDKILSYLPYDQVSKIRAVSRTFNNICCKRLNNGFIAFEKFHNKCIRAVKVKLPRRESERKHHPLARHCDILMAIETRFSTLSMTFTKHIEMGHCCFIPGKVLDEGFRLLRIVSKSITPPATGVRNINLPRPYEFLQEYRDISSMAMEHFDDKILPSIREKMRLENPRFYAYKNKLVHNNDQCPHKIAEKNQQTLLQQLRNFNAKYKKAHRVVKDMHHSAALEAAGLRQENRILKRKCNQLTSMTTFMKKEIADLKNTVSSLTHDLNQVKSEESSSNVESSRSGLATNSAMKLYSLLRHTDRKCNSTHKAFVILNRNMKIIKKKLKAQGYSQKSLLQRLHINRASVKQKKMKLNPSRTLPSMAAIPSCSTGANDDLMIVEDN